MATWQILGSNLDAEGVGTTAFGQPRVQGSIHANHKLPWWPVLSTDLTVLHFGTSLASVENVRYQIQDGHMKKNTIDLSLGKRRSFMSTWRLTPIRLAAAHRALLTALLSILAVGCANGWPSARHPPPVTAKGTCKTTSSRIVHSDCSTITPASQMSGDELDRERHTKGNGTAVLGVIPPF